MKGVIRVKKEKTLKFDNVIRYLDEACNNCILTDENFILGTTELNYKQNYFRYMGVSIEYHNDITYFRFDRSTYIAKRYMSGIVCSNIVYLMRISIMFERSLHEWVLNNVIKQ
nr:MAG TPA: hypothetical protein [Bacteriophage sp.]